jgi:hypothetical protein
MMFHGLMIRVSRIHISGPRKTSMPLASKDRNESVASQALEKAGDDRRKKP